jgi:hypothetical protein
MQYVGPFLKFDGGWVSNILHILALLGFGLLFALKGHDKVDQGHLALKTRFGKVVMYKFGKSKKGHPKVVDPGFKFLVPFMHSLRKIDVRNRTRPLVIQLRKTVVGYEDVHVFLIFAVNTEDPWGVYNAEMSSDGTDAEVARCHGLDTQVIAHCERALLQLVKVGRSDLEIEQELPDKVKQQLELIGVILKNVLVTQVRETNEALLAISFKDVGLPPSPLVIAATNGHMLEQPAPPPAGSS